MDEGARLVRTPAQVVYLLAMAVSIGGSQPMAERDRVQVRPDGAGEADEPAIRILLIEDDAGDALLVQEMLAQSGAAFSYTWESDLAGGLRALDAGADCILVDLGLPDSRDLEVVDAVLGRDPGAAVIVLTGFDDRSAGARAVAAGAQDYLVKGGWTTRH